MDVVRLQNYHAFLARLGDAIRQQQTLLDEARVDVEHCAAQWRETRAEAAAMGKVVDSLRSHEQRERDRREQQDHDERALRSPSSSIVRE